MAGSWSGTPATYTPGEMMNDTILNTELRDRMLWLAGADGKAVQIQYFQGLGGMTTTSTAAVSLTGFVTPAMTTLAGSLVAVFGWLSVNGSAAGAVTNLYIQADAGGYAIVASASIPTNTYGVQLAGAMIFTPSGGSHTWNLGWAISGGTGTAGSATSNGIIAIEFRTH